MTYAFNDDKSKSEVYVKSEVYSKSEAYAKSDFDKTWTDIVIPENSYISGVLKYSIDVNGEVTLIGNLDFRAMPANQGYTFVDQLPTEIVPKGTMATPAGIGVRRNVPVMLTVTGQKRVGMTLGSQLSFKALDAISDGDYLIFEYKYNPTL